VTCKGFVLIGFGLAGFFGQGRRPGDGLMAGVVVVSGGGVSLEGTLEAGGFSGGSSPFRPRTEFRAGMLTPHLKPKVEISRTNH
jgi:hypothetical protein